MKTAEKRFYDVQNNYQQLKRWCRKNHYNSKSCIKYLLDKYPAEFKHVHGGKTVEKIARILNMGKTTVGDYVNISKNLGDKGREALEKGRINKSAALALASLPEEKQEELIMDGKTTIQDL